MSYPSVGQPDPLSRATLDGLVSAIRPGWDVLDVEPIPDSSDIVYALTVETGAGRATARSERAAVLKCFRDVEALSFRTHDRFLVEVDLLELVGRETDLPVPGVLGVCESHAELPAPAFLMDRLPGRPVTGLPVPAEGDASDRMLREAGRALATIHELRTFEDFGTLVRDAEGRTGSSAGVIAVEDARDQWRDRLRDILADALDDVDERFAALETPLREYVRERIESLDLEADSVLLHGDYRPGNLLADPETRDLTAVLDWGAAQAGDPRYELAWAVREFSNREPVDSPVRRRVRDALVSAYESERGDSFERDEAFDRLQRFYLAVTWIAELGSFELWWAGADESVKAARADQLRERVNALF